MEEIIQLLDALKTTVALQKVPLGMWCFKITYLASIKVHSATNAPGQAIHNATPITSNRSLFLPVYSESSSFLIAHADGQNQQEPATQSPSSSLRELPLEGHQITQVVQPNGSNNDVFNSSEMIHSNDSLSKNSSLELDLSQLLIRYLRSESRRSEPEPESHWLKFGIAVVTAGVLNIANSLETEQIRKRRKIAAPDSSSNIIAAQKPDAGPPTRDIKPNYDLDSSSESCEMLDSGISSDDESSVASYTSRDLRHPMFDEYLSRLGDADLCYEEHSDLVMEHKHLLELQEANKKAGKELLVEDQVTLASFPTEEAKILERLKEIEADVKCLRQACVRKGILCESDGEIEVEVEGDGTDILDPSNESVDLEQATHNKYPRLLEQLGEVEDEEMSKSLLSGFIQGDTSDRINRWLLHKLQSSRLEVELLARFSEGLRPTADTKQWLEEVHKFWFVDSANLPPSAYKAEPTLTRIDCIQEVLLDENENLIETLKLPNEIGSWIEPLNSLCVPTSGISGSRIVLRTDAASVKILDEGESEEVTGTAATGYSEQDEDWFRDFVNPNMCSNDLLQDTSQYDIFSGVSNQLQSSTQPDTIEHRRLLNSQDVTKSVTQQIIDCIDPCVTVMTQVERSPNISLDLEQSVLDTHTSSYSSDYMNKISGLKKPETSPSIMSPDWSKDLHNSSTCLKVPSSPPASQTGTQLVLIPASFPKKHSNNCVYCNRSFPRLSDLK